MTLAIHKKDAQSVLTPPPPGNCKLSKMITKILAVSEAVHALLHIKVLFGVGTLYTVEELDRKRNYFILDMLSVATSCITVLYTSTLTFDQTMFITAISILHIMLHIFYVAQWTLKNSFFIQSIKEWSAESQLSRRIAKHGLMMFIYNTTGTIFDIYAHIILCKVLWEI